MVNADAATVAQTSEKEGVQVLLTLLEEPPTRGSSLSFVELSRHCEEPTGRANARPMTGSATKQSSLLLALDWFASLAMTVSIGFLALCNDRSAAGGGILDDRSKSFPALAVEPHHLQLLVDAIVVRRRVDDDSRQREVELDVL